MSRPQFRLRSLFILTAIVAVGCLVYNLWPQLAPRYGTATVREMELGESVEITWPTGRREVAPPRNQGRRL